MQIVLATLNARYIHTAFGLRYLQANMGELQGETGLFEFTIDQRPLDIAEKLLNHQPKIIGFGVYIWNTTQTLETIALIKTLSPETTLVLGGPEISYETQQQTHSQYADYVITGNAEISFAKLCHAILRNKAPAEQIISAELAPLDALNLPYRLYTESDIAHRVIYVEASRGCPFKCTFCLSALDKTATPFALEHFLEKLSELHKRGVRSFKFVDRTFNLNTQVSTAIMQFFLDLIARGSALFVHFEVVPDRLPQALRKVIAQFPAGSLQFEIGVQTFNPKVQQLISRKQDTARSIENIQWLRTHSGAHLHTDLIFGLPGESLQSMGHSFDQLINLNPHEIQVGILKRLRGMPLIALTSEYQLRFNPNPPYEILSTSLVDFDTLQRLRRFARYWDLIGNSGRFQRALPLILGQHPFERFLRLSDWLHETTKQTHKIGLRRLFELLYRGLPNALGLSSKDVLDALQEDYQLTKMKGQPDFLRRTSVKATPRESKANRRQLAHTQ